MAKAFFKYPAPSPSGEAAFLTAHFLAGGPDFDFLPFSTFESSLKTFKKWYLYHDLSHQNEQVRFSFGQPFKPCLDPF